MKIDIFSLSFQVRGKNRWLALFCPLFRVPFLFLTLPWPQHVIIFSQNFNLQMPRHTGKSIVAKQREAVKQEERRLERLREQVLAEGDAFVKTLFESHDDPASLLPRPALKQVKAKFRF